MASEAPAGSHLRCIHVAIDGASFGLTTMKQTIPTSLRRPEQRYDARALADQLLRADARRRRRMAANDELGGTAPAPIRTKHEDGPFAALRNHPQYPRAAERRISSPMNGEKSHGA